MTTTTETIYAEATVSGVRYQWLAWATEGEGIVVAYQEGHGGRWQKLGVTREWLYGGSVKGLLEETVSRWLSYSEANGLPVRRTA